MYGRRAAIDVDRASVLPIVDHTSMAISQHRMLVDLENTGQQVYYAAPIFHVQSVFNAEFQGNTVVNR